MTILQLNFSIELKLSIGWLIKLDCRQNSTLICCKHKIQTFHQIFLLSVRMQFLFEISSYLFIIMIVKQTLKTLIGLLSIGIVLENSGLILLFSEWELYARIGTEELLHVVK